MSNTADTVREVLLESPYVNEVLAVEADERIVGVRFCLANVPDLYALAPVFAQLRAAIKAAVAVEHVFLEPDITEHRSAVPTEAIVIRGSD